VPCGGPNIRFKALSQVGCGDSVEPAINAIGPILSQEHSMRDSATLSPVACTVPVAAIPSAEHRVAPF